MSRRVVVTGVGLLSSVGSGTEETWRSLMQGHSGIGPITQFDATAFNCRIAGEVKDFDPALWIEKKEIKKMARFIQFAIAALGVRDAGVRPQGHPDESRNKLAYISGAVSADSR